MRLGRFLSPPSHNRTFVRNMVLHSDIGILSKGDSDRRVAQWTYLNRISKLIEDRTGGRTDKMEPHDYA